MSNLVVVAIPDENDRVWQFSSEKIPHCTLLFLGEADEVSNVDQIVQFVEHAAKTTMHRFYLPVDRRGTLGEDEADVLFFKKNRYDYKAIRDFRAQLLKDNNIRTAYDSAEQHDGIWLPHLTLGYPDNPAKADDSDYPQGFYDVAFNKIAVWPEDYEGPEFLLKDWWDEWETMEASPVDVAMSETKIISVQEARAALGLNRVVTGTPEEQRQAALEHFGVKGMKWGVRKSADAAKAVGRTADNVAFNIGTTNSRVQRGIADEAHRTMKKEDLPAIKSQHGAHAKARVRLVTPLSKESKAYRKDVKEAYLKRLEESANKRTNFQGNRRYTLAENGKPNTKKYTWTLKVEKIDKAAKHADEKNVDLLGVSFTVHPVFDGEGFITDFEHVDGDEMAQSAIDLGEDYILEHFGVKGMKWGVRKAVEKVKAGAKAVGRGLAALGASLADSSWQSSTYSDARHEAVHNTVAQRIDNQVDKLARSPKYRGKDLKADSNLKNEYKQDVAKVTSSAYRKAVKDVYGENYTGTKTAHYVTDARGPRIEVRNKKTGELDTEAKLTSMKEIKKRRKAEAQAAKEAFGHAAIKDEAPDLIIELKHDENDQIIGVGFVKPREDDSLAQGVDLSSIKLSDIGNDGAFIEHFGVKGMRWGVRNKRPAPVAVEAKVTSVVPHGRKRKTKLEVEGGHNHPAHDDAIRVAAAKIKLKKSGTAALSNQELREVANRVRLENEVAVLTSSKGKLFVKRELENEGQQLVKRKARRAAPKIAKTAGKVAVGALV